MNDPVLRCPHCGNEAPHRLLADHSYDEKFGYDSKTGLPDEDGGPPCEYIIRICSSCNDLSVYHVFGYNEPTLVYPSQPDFPKSVPESVRSCYAEAARVQNSSPNAYAVLIRRALEALCEDKGIVEDSLDKQLKKLGEKYTIPPVFAEMTTILRKMGNTGAHHDRRCVTVPETWAMDRFFQAIIEYVYVAPARLEEFKKKMSELESDEPK